ncbi:MAG: hypothetical protein DRO14_05780 [Thermoprotei archaeon]|nr:MAG: hypothetical protein DRO14_05780 [Thermoprotei archaeon]
MAEAFGWFGFSILEEMDMEERVEKLEREVERLQERVRLLEKVVDTIRVVLIEHVEWELEEYERKIQGS